MTRDTLALREHLTRPIYTLPDADYLAAASRGTSRRWLSGYQDWAGPAPPNESAVSFVDLVEIVAISRMRERGFSLQLIRRVVHYCQDFFEVPRPLSTLKFKTGGESIFATMGKHGPLLEAGRQWGMLAWREILDPFLEDLDYAVDLGLARRWWPLGRNNPVVVDPEYGFGFPVVAKSGVRTEIILERFKAGDLREQIAEDFGLDSIAVERALQFELQRAA